MTTMEKKMTLKERLMTEVKTAMKAKQKERLATLRLVMAAIKQIEVDERIELDDARTLSVLEKMVKQRKDSIEQFAKADRQDLIAVEQAELEVIKEFMPEPTSEEELTKIVMDAITKTGAESMKDMGKVMGMASAKLAGQADAKTLSGIVKSLLG